jgi:beta-mannosidase
LDPGDLRLTPTGPQERVDLIFDGIDTVATVRVVGEGPDKIELGRTYNMHRSYRFDISPYVGGGLLDLEVDLHSATAYAEAERQRLGDRPGPTRAINFVRKMACLAGTGV